MDNDMQDLKAFQSGSTSLRYTADALDGLGDRLSVAEMPVAADIAYRCAAEIREARKMIETGYDGLLGESVAHSQAMMGNLLVATIEGCLTPKRS